MQFFRDELQARLRRTGSEAAGKERSWVFVPYDQLSDRIGPLAAASDPNTLGILLVESPWKAGRRPYHKRKLALILANMRHFALEQAERGVAVRYVVHDGSYREALEAQLPETGPLQCMEPAERELRVDLEALRASGDLEYVPHDGWLTTRAQFDAAGDGPWRMDRFYRRVRRDAGILMDGDKPVGGKWSLDAENRKPWKGTPAAPDFPCFAPDEITSEVIELVNERFGHHPGTLDASTLPATKADAEALWQWSKRHCLEHFGPFEDAMTVESATLFHTRTSALLHLHRLLPRDCLEDVLALEIELSSKEGFVRQLIGWREFMRWVHIETDGFRELPPESQAVVALKPTGDAGWSRWSGRPWNSETEASTEACTEGSDASPRTLTTHKATIPLPKAFWGSESGLNCLDHVVREVWEEGYSHHINRLMILSNLATLLGVDTRELTDWFWVAYEDAFDWVVEPNVLGMGTFALGDLFTTKPYVSGSAYIHRMSDYCAGCAYHPKKDCPITRFYWAFLAENEADLAGNPRIAMPLRSLAKRDAAKRAEDAAIREEWRTRLRDV